MALSKTLIDEFVKATNDRKHETKETTVYATIVESGSQIGAQFDGSDIITPVHTTANVKDGDRVIVTIKNHEAVVTGSTTAPSASNRDLLDVEGKVAEVDKLIAGAVTVEYLAAETARIELLIADKIGVDELTAESARIEQLIAGKVSADDLDAKYAKIDFANVKELDVENLLVRGSFLTNDINSATGSFSKYLTGVRIHGDIIDANTLKANKLILQGDDGLYYQLNVNSLGEATVSSNPTKYTNNLDGSVLVAESVTASKINVDDLFAQKVTATNMTITGNSTFGSAAGTNIIVDGNTIKFRQATNPLATFGSDSIHLGINSLNSKIYFCNDAGHIWAEKIKKDTDGREVERLGINTEEFYTKSGHVFLGTSTQNLVSGQTEANSSYANIFIDSWQPVNATKSDGSTVGLESHYKPQSRYAAMGIASSANVSEISLETLGTNGRGYLILTDSALDSGIAASYGGPSLDIKANTRLTGVLEATGTVSSDTGLATGGTISSNGNIYLSENADGIFTGGKTTYGEGKEGVHIRKNGRIYMEGGSVTPGLYFYHGGQTSNGAHIIYDSTTDYLKFNNASQYTFGSTIKVNNGVAYTSVNAAGDSRCNLIWLGTDNNLFLGGGSYPPDAVRIVPGSGYGTFVESSLFATASIFSGDKRSTDDGVTGCVLSSSGRLHLQNTTGNPTINFYGNSTSMGSRISYDIANDSLNITSAAGYSFDNDVYFNSSTLYVEESIRIGKDDTSSSLGTRGIGTIWKDGSSHYIITRGTDGLTAYFGWSGSSSYGSVGVLRGRTVKYTNSTGTTTLSDERLKKDFTSLDKYDAFFDALEPCAFRMKGGNSGRYHIGFKARQVEQALLDNGLTTQDFAGFIRMTYTPDPEDPEGNAVYEEAGIKEGDDEFGLIYTEFPALNAAQIQKLKRRVARIEAALGISDVM